MALLGVSHLAVVVPDLGAAEDYYRALLGLEVSFREAPTDDGWATLDETDDVAIARFAMLTSGGVVVALEVGEVAGSGPVDHIGLSVDGDTIETTRAALGDEVVKKDRAELLMFTDRYGVMWELDTRSYAGAASMSSAATAASAS